MLKYLITCLLLISMVTVANATMTAGIHDSKQTNATLTTVSNAKTTTTGSGLIVGIAYQPTDSVVTFVDFYNNVWKEIQSEQYYSWGIKARAWYCQRCTGGAGHTFSITMAQGISQTIYVQEVKASAGNGIFLDNSGRIADVASPFTSPLVPTNVANEFLWSMAISGASATGDVFTASNSFTMVENQTDSLNGIGGALGYRIVTSTGTYQSSWTAAISTQTGQWIGTFSETASVAGQLLTDFNVRTEPTLPVMGAAGSKVTDPTFGTTILRVTDANDGAWAQTPYSTYPSVNANSTRVMATVAPISNNKFWVLNPDTFTVSNGSLANSSASVIAQHFFRWSGTNPDLLFGAGNPNALGVNSARLYSYNHATGVTTLIKDFSGMTLAGITPGNANNYAVLYQMQSSRTDDVFSFNIQRRQNGITTDVGFLFYKRSTDTVLLNVTNSNTNETYVDKSGNYGYVIIDPYPAVLVYNLSTQALIATLSTNGFSHNGVGVGSVFTGVDNCNCMALTPLASPNSPVFHMAGYFNTGGESHHISLNSDEESYGLVSRFTTSGGGVTNAFDNEILLVSTTGNAVKRIAHHRSITNVYEASPFANISRDGRIVAFTSTWGTNLNSGGRRDLYLVRLPAPDTTAPFLTAAFPTIDLPAGTTTADPSVIADETAVVKYGTSDVAYASLPSTAVASSLTHTGHVTGLTDGSTTIVSFRGQDTALNTDTVSTNVTIHVAASTIDVTPPGNITLSGTILDSTHLSFTWPLATGGDIAGNQIYLCLNPCTPDFSMTALTTSATALAAIIPSLLPNTTYDIRARAFDTSINFSAAYSNKVTLTTSAAADITGPTPPINLHLSQIVNTNALLAFISGVDSGSGVGAHTVEQCSGSLTCSDFIFKSQSADPLIRVTGLLASTAYCWRVFDTDILGNLGVAGNVTCGTTRALSPNQYRAAATTRVQRAQ